MSRLRCLPWVRTQQLSPADRKELQSLADDLIVYVIPSPMQKGGRTWRVRIDRVPPAFGDLGSITVAETSPHERPMAAFETARLMLEHRERVR